MNKAELINSVAASADVSKKEAEAVVSATFDAITAALKDGDQGASWWALDPSRIKKRAARVGQQPKHKESIEMPRFCSARVQGRQGLKDAVAK